MLDQTQDNPHSLSETAVDTYDLVVIGAGIAGLNALFAACEYLPNTARVLLIDQKDKAGGMWNTAYDYVRLHQPHPMFTVGDMKWNWNKPASYLAAKPEVQKHLASALELVADKVALETRFGQTVSSCREVETDTGFRAEVTYHPNEQPNTHSKVSSVRAIFAAGLDYQIAAPLKFSSGDVVSIAPYDLLETLAAHPNAPLYVAGGGKTAMDSVLAALKADANRSVTLIKGRGTNFFNRTKFIPTGVKRWASGKLISRFFWDLATNFDGDNEEDLIRYVRAEYSTDPESENSVFLYGLQSEDEHHRIHSGLSNTLEGYLEDIKNTDQSPQMVLRDGTTHPVPKGSIFVNCTGSFFRNAEMGQEMPFLSSQGCVLSLTARDGIHFLTSVAGFFATHLLYRDAMRGKGFCTLDHEALFRKNRNAWVGASAAQAYMNQTIAVQNLPMSLLDRCGLDLDRWYPLPRRMIALMQMKTGAARDIKHCRNVLDKVAERFDVNCRQID